MAGHLLPAPLLLHPDPREAEVLGLPGIRHLPAEHEGLVPRHNDGVAVIAHVFDLPLIGGERQESGSDHGRAMASASPCSMACTSCSFNSRTSRVAALSAAGLSAVA